MSYPPLPDFRKFVVPEVVFGEGALRLVGRYVKNLGGKRALIVSDEGVVRAGWAEEVARCLEDSGIQFSIFSGIMPNPRAEEVMEGARIYKKERCNILVAVGGGSPIDGAKGIGIVSTNERTILDFTGVDLIPVPGPPLICVPTTIVAADISQFAVITDTENKMKKTIASKTLVPDITLLDPATTMSMTKKLTVNTGMDAFTHAIEAYVSNASSPITDILALSAVKIIGYHLKALMSDPESKYHRSKAMQAGIWAGMAFSNACLGLTHAMSHSLGGLTDLPHGECNAILSPYVIGFNYDSVPGRYDRIAEAMCVDLVGLDHEGKKAAVVDAIARFQKSLGNDERLGQLGITKDDIPQLARKAMGSIFIVTNPRKPELEDVIDLFNKAL